MFKKGDKIVTEAGDVGEILFVDRDGLEAQVALTRVNAKLRTDSLREFQVEVAPKGRRVKKCA